MDEKFEPEEDTVNVIPYGNAASVDEKECVRLLTMLGLKVQTPLSVPYTTINKVKEARRAKANTMMCMTFGWNFARAMSRKFGTVMVPESHPLSIHYTNKWLRSVAATFGRDKQAEELVSKELRAIEGDLKELRSQLQGKRIALSAGHDKMPSLLALAAELGMCVVYAGLITYDDLVEDKLREIAAAYDYDFPSVLFPQTYEEIAIIKKFDPDVYVGPAGLTPKNVMTGIPSVSTHFNDFIGPYFGYRGVVIFAREILNAIRDPLPRYAPDHFVIRGNERICGKEWFDRFTVNGAIQ